MKKYKTFTYQEKLEKGLELVEKDYLDEHPEMQGVFISKNKLLFEMIKFYLKGTKYLKDFENEIQQK